MADNNLLQYHFRKMKKAEKLDYKSAFDNLYANTIATTNRKTSMQVDKLLSLKKSFQDKEKNFYKSVTGQNINSYQDFRKMINAFFENKENKALFEDLQKISNRGLHANAELLSLITTQTNFTPAQQLEHKDKQAYDQVVKEVASELMPVKIENKSLVLTAIGEKILDDSKDFLFIEKPAGGWSLTEKSQEELNQDKARLLQSFLEEYFHSLKQQKAQDIFASELSANISEAMRTGKSLSSAIQQVSSAVQQGSLLYTEKKGKTLNWTKNYEFQRKTGSTTTEKVMKKVTFSLGTDGVQDKTDGAYLTVLPTITYGRLLKEKISNKLNTFDSKKENTVVEKTKMQNPLTSFGKIVPSQLPDDAPEGSNIPNKKDMNLAIKKWITSPNGLGLTSEPIVSYLNTIPNNTIDLIVACTSPSGIVGYLSELGTTALFSALKKGTTAKVENIGGSHGSVITESAENILLEQIWRKMSSQPPVDILIENAGKYFGIQAKHSYAAIPGKAHTVGFINTKQINQIFEEDLGEEKEFDPTLIHELIPLLLGYFGNIAIQSFLLSTSQGEGAVNIAQIPDAIHSINKIMDLFIASSLDLGEYTIVEKNNQKYLREKNLFFMYLVEYFIPASQMIQWIVDSIEHKEDTSFSRVQRGTGKDLKKAQGKYIAQKKKEKISAENVENSAFSNLLKMSIGYSFQPELLDNFNLLATSTKIR